jgi:hypothetical protein
MRFATRNADAQGRGSTGSKTWCRALRTDLILLRRGLTRSLLVVGVDSSHRAGTDASMRS